MRVVIASWGAAGDVLPTIAIGWELTRRGHRVTFVGNPYFAARAAEAGLSFAPVGTVADHENLMADADVFDRATKSWQQIGAEHYFPHLEELYRTVVEACHPGPSVIVGWELASLAVAEKFGVPIAYVACSPWNCGWLWSKFDPPHPERTLPAWARWFAASGRRLSLLYRLRGLARRIVISRSDAPFRLPDDHPLARLRARVGLPELSQFRAQRILCMWPEWFAPPQPDWPKEAVIAGFPLWPRPTFSASGGSTAASEGGPIVVTTGSLVARQHKFYAAVVTACKALRRPAILVTPHRDHVPRDLPPDIIHLEFAPFNELFGRASLVLHHGGIGTASYALAAGIPQIVMPMRGDQFDNCNRLARLGVATVLPEKEVRPERFARAISALLDSKGVRQRCRYWQARIDPDEGLRRAADSVEELAG